MFCIWLNLKVPANSYKCQIQVRANVFATTSSPLPKPAFPYIKILKIDNKNMRINTSGR